MCAKCSLKETSACQNAIKVKEGGKTVTYYLVHNQVSKDFHKNICTSTAKVTATGTVTEANGKLEMSPTKIELDKIDQRSGIAASPFCSDDLLARIAPLFVS